MLRKQPQTKDELYKNAGINISTFYRVLSHSSTIEKAWGIKETSEGFVLSTYIELEKAIENALDKLEKGYSAIAFDKISSEVGVNSSEIESIIYRIVKKSRDRSTHCQRRKSVSGKSSRDEQINQIPKSYQKVQS